MNFRDVFEGYRKCTFCGKVLPRGHDFTPPGAQPGERYCSEACWSFSTRYEELKAALMQGKGKELEERGRVP